MQLGHMMGLLKLIFSIPEMTLLAISGRTKIELNVGEKMSSNSVGAITAYQTICEILRIFKSSIIRHELFFVANCQHSDCLSLKMGSKWRLSKAA